MHQKSVRLSSRSRAAFVWPALPSDEEMEELVIAQGSTCPSCTGELVARGVYLRRCNTVMLEYCNMCVCCVCVVSLACTGMPPPSEVFDISGQVQWPPREPLPEKRNGCVFAAWFWFNVLSLFSTQGT